MARQISELRPKAQAAYAASPDLTAARNAQTAPAAAADAAPAPSSGGGGSISLPTASDIPGGSALEKALVVLGILVLGLGIFSRVTGKPINLGLTGFTGTAPKGLPSATVASLPLTPTIVSRTAAVNPAKVGA